MGSYYIRVLQPLDSVGLMKTNMVHVLRTLRDNQEVLVSIMAIYLKVRRADCKLTELLERGSLHVKQLSYVISPPLS